MTWTLLLRGQAWLASVLVTVALSACGGGGDAPAVASSINGPSRAVANTRYTYQANSPDASGVSWNWGDGTPDSSGASVQKVWRKAGSFNIQTSAASLSVAVVGEPISAGSSHSCALQANGRVMCWGGNLYGQVGNGTTSTAVVSPVAVAVLSDAVAISAGNQHGCALQTSGAVVCWGYNGLGGLGNGTTTRAVSPVAVTGLNDAVVVSAGEFHTCALKASGNVVCWGANQFGQLGDDSVENKYTPAAVAVLSDAVAVSAGTNHNCALKASGSVVCWGQNRYGQLGNGTTTALAVVSPVAVIGLSDAVAVSAGEFHTCALRASGSVVCWGDNDNGQLGDASTEKKYTPVAVNGLSDALAVNAGSQHNCALKASGSVVCWGANGKGQLGDSGSLQGQTSPVAVTSLANAIAISAGSNYTCALQASGNALCWGNNGSGRLGDGTTVDKLVPTSVAGGAIFWK
jgi:alpha-tubulin suppressor-like RCC1 family protein